MPEGHSVRRLARQFADVFGGQALAVSSPQGRFAAGAALLDGHAMIESQAHGKHLFLHFDHALVLHVHLGLYGAWDFGGDAAFRGASSIGAPALALLIVLALVAVAVEVVSLRPRSAETRSDQAAQSAVVRAAERFTVQVNTYDAGSMDSQSAMNSMMSPKFRADYQKVIEQAASTIEQAGSSKGDVLASAVASVDTDSAQVLVVSDTSRAVPTGHGVG